MKPARIVIFAKAPVAGLAKTRLIPTLGAQGAARLARHMLANTLDQAVRADIGPVGLCTTPSFDDPAWQGIAVPATVHISKQGEGDLGARLARATQRVIDGGESVLLIGTDCPGLTATHLRLAATKLDQFDAVLNGTIDGGYALLGLNRYHPHIFSSIAWSSDTVAFATLCRMGELGWRPYIAERLRDIDEPADLTHLPRDWIEVGSRNTASRRAKKSFRARGTVSFPGRN